MLKFTNLSSYCSIHKRKHQFTNKFTNEPLHNKLRGEIGKKKFFF